MDRLETYTFFVLLQQFIRFTFQYGQIRNFTEEEIVDRYIDIYIPVWIDQKLSYSKGIGRRYADLHSSMDRLET